MQRLVMFGLGMLLGLPLTAHASELTLNTANSDQKRPRLLLAQFEGGDAYDPFSDYSEFESSEEEEADINFFRHGRFFTLGFMGGYRGFTENLGDLYSSSMSFGLFLSYFFDMRFALQLQFLTGDHKYAFNAAGTPASGNIGLTTIGFNLKYYINTQNVTRGIAQLNPYIIGGFAQVYRTATANGQDAFAKEGALGFEGGGGIEFPMMRNKMYTGLQATYQMVTFKDENSEIIVQGTRTGIYPKGDVYHVLAILGVNF